MLLAQDTLASFSLKTVSITNQLNNKKYISDKTKDTTDGYEKYVDSLFFTKYYDSIVKKQ